MVRMKQAYASKSIRLIFCTEGFIVILLSKVHSGFLPE